MESLPSLTRNGIQSQAAQGLGIQQSVKKDSQNQEYESKGLQKINENLEAHHFRGGGGPMPHKENNNSVTSMSTYVFNSNLNTNRSAAGNQEFNISAGNHLVVLAQSSKQWVGAGIDNFTNKLSNNNIVISNQNSKQMPAADHHKRASTLSEIKQKSASALNKIGMGFKNQTKNYYDSCTTNTNTVQNVSQSVTTTVQEEEILQNSQQTLQKGGGLSLQNQSTSIQTQGTFPLQSKGKKNMQYHKQLLQQTQTQIVQNQQKQGNSSHRNLDRHGNKTHQTQDFKNHSTHIFETNKALSEEEDSDVIKIEIHKDSEVENMLTEDHKSNMSLLYYDFNGSKQRKLSQSKLLQNSKQHKASSIENSIIPEEDLDLFQPEDNQSNTSSSQKLKLPPFDIQKLNNNGEKINMKLNKLAGSGFQSQHQIFKTKSQIQKGSLTELNLQNKDQLKQSFISNSSQNKIDNSSRSNVFQASSKFVLIGDRDSQKGSSRALHKNSKDIELVNQKIQKVKQRTQFTKDISTISKGVQFPMKMHNTLQKQSQKIIQNQNSTKTTSRLHGSVEDKSSQENDLKLRVAASTNRENIASPFFGKNQVSKQQNRNILQQTGEQDLTKKLIQEQHKRLESEDTAAQNKLSRNVLKEPASIGVDGNSPCGRNQLTTHTLENITLLDDDQVSFCANDQQSNKVIASNSDTKLPQGSLKSNPTQSSLADMLLTKEKGLKLEPKNVFHHNCKLEEEYGNSEPDHTKLMGRTESGQNNPFHLPADFKHEQRNAHQDYKLSSFRSSDIIVINQKQSLPEKSTTSDYNYYNDNVIDRANQMILVQSISSSKNFSQAAGSQDQFQNESQFKLKYKKIKQMQHHQNKSGNLPSAQTSGSQQYAKVQFQQSKATLGASSSSFSQVAQQPKIIENQADQIQENNYQTIQNYQLQGGLSQQEYLTPSVRFKAGNLATQQKQHLAAKNQRYKKQIQHSSQSSMSIYNDLHQEGNTLFDQHKQSSIVEYIQPNDEIFK